MKIRVWWVGTRRDPALDPLVDDYLRRSAPLGACEARGFRDTAGMLASLTSPWIALDERGWQPGTLELAGWLGELRDRGCRVLHFAIGAAHGFAEAERAQADRVLSLSALTLPHRLARLVLAEQLYRASCVLTGHPYHHA